VTDDSADPTGEDQLAGAPVESVLDAIRALNATVDGLSAQVAREHDRAKARETVIDRLHEENQVLHADQPRAFLRPVLADLRQLRDDLLGQARSVPAAMPPANVATLLESYAESVAIILERYGVIAVSPQPGTPFDPRRHRAAGTAAAPEPELDGLIASVLSDGYEDARAGMVIAAARVTVYRPAGSGEPAGQDG
jgi:molecular chaperone GrpE (heat shock protein)